MTKLILNENIIRSGLLFNHNLRNMIILIVDQMKEIDAI